MINTQDLIAQLRKDAHHHIDGQMAGLMDEAADALEAAQAEIEKLKTSLAGAAKAISENAVTMWNMRTESEAALARLAEVEKQEPIGYLYDWVHSSAIGYWDTTDTGFTKDKTHAGKHDNAIAIYAAAGASTVQPSQAKCQTCGSDCNERDELIKAEREIEQLRMVLNQEALARENVSAMRQQLAVDVEKLRKDAARYRWLREYLPSDDLQYDDDLVLAKTGEEVDAVIDAAINAKESK